MDVSEVTRLKSLEDADGKLKKGAAWPQPDSAPHRCSFITRVRRHDGPDWTGLQTLRAADARGGGHGVGGHGGGGHGGGGYGGRGGIGGRAFIGPRGGVAVGPRGGVAVGPRGGAAVGPRVAWRLVLAVVFM